jgi:hypothetical protein
MRNGVSVESFPFDFGSGGLAGQRAQFRAGEVFVELDVLWSPTALPEADAQVRDLGRWVDTVLQASK